FLPQSPMSTTRILSRDILTVPGEVGSDEDGYVHLLVFLSIFASGTLVILCGVLIICRYCCETERRHLNRPLQAHQLVTCFFAATEITIKVDDPDGTSSSSHRDTESERFLSSGSSTGRRVSFNEAALFEQSKKTHEKGRRYTLTEGDFHHLKNARLIHLPLPPPPALKIVTIHECESNDSAEMTPRRPPAKPNLAIFQVWTLPQTALTGHAMCPSSALPGDTFNSSVEASATISSDSSEGTSLDVEPRGPKGGRVSSGAAKGHPPARSPGNVLHFFTRLRRHTSLEGASPYFKIKKWKLEMSQRASSLDTRGSPKRHQFQRQRAASESMDQEDRDAHQTDIIQYIARTDNVASPPRLPFALCARPCKRSVSPACRLDRSEPSAPAPAEPPPPDQQPTPVCHDIWSLRASLEMCASAEQGNDRDSIRSEGGDSASSSGGPPSPEGAEADAGPRKLLQMDSGYASIEGPGGRAGEDQTAGGAAGGALPHSPLAWAPHGQLFPAREGLPRRDYSIDEKTDALFHAFVRHDPQFDESPLRAKLRSRAHLRKQWQRARQHSDPGARYPAALERHRTPLRRGDSVDGPPEGRGAGLAEIQVNHIHCMPSIQPPPNLVIEFHKVCLAGPVFAEAVLCGRQPPFPI
uniref:CACN subunit beta associated regulatory protein n=1 Tax=Varanus komodoensis TaxID=61221 RepID=A0A8D2LAB4_VARKO